MNNRKTTKGRKVQWVTDGSVKEFVTNYFTKGKTKKKKKRYKIMKRKVVGKIIHT